MRKVIVCGGRDYDKYAHVCNFLDAFHVNFRIDLLIEGGARGADYCAKRWALSRGVQVAEFVANWDHYGKSAGMLRNKNMLILEPDTVIAFPGGKGTEGMVKFAQEAGVEVVRGNSVS